MSAIVARAVFIIHLLNTILCPPPASSWTAKACSFFVSNYNATRPSDGDVLKRANYYNRFRGPDATRIEYVKGWTFLHNLLSMTGDFATQPFVSDDGVVVAAVFNGEIYNYRELANELEGGDDDAYASDGFAILPAYDKWGPENFVRHLHGEFALVVVDFSRGIVVLSTDVFSTKPLWYGTWPCDASGGEVRRGSRKESKTCFAAASYESVLRGMGVPKERRYMANANEALVLSLSDHEEVFGKESFAVTSRRPIFEFDLNQHKTSTDDWQKAFVEAVRIRTDRIKHKIFLGISAGFDTGAVMLALELLGRPFYAYYLANSKDDDSVVLDRVDYCTHADGTWIQLDEKTYKEHGHWLKKRCEVTQSNITKKWTRWGLSPGFSFIFSKVRERGGLIFVTGTGADEHMSMYSRNGRVVPGYEHMACPNSTFPVDLDGFFPWCSFYYGSMRDQIMVTEFTGGANGIETRYPFLDPLVVQEYLWLTAEVKNSEYKKPIADFFRRNNFPNMWETKAPFRSHEFYDETSVRPIKRSANAQASRKQRVAAEVQPPWDLGNLNASAFVALIALTQVFLCSKFGSRWISRGRSGAAKEK